MSAEALLSRLEKVRRTGPGTWTACCPAHDDKHPSLSIREFENGIVVLKCWTGCSVESILGAVGLEFDALFPPRPVEHARPLRRVYPAADVLEALVREATVVALAGRHLLDHGQLSTEAHERLIVACARIEEGRRLANG